MAAEDSCVLEGKKHHLICGLCARHWASKYLLYGLLYTEPYARFTTWLCSVLGTENSRSTSSERREFVCHYFWCKTPAQHNKSGFTP